MRDVACIFHEMPQIVLGVVELARFEQHTGLDSQPYTMQCSADQIAGSVAMAASRRTLSAATMLGASGHSSAASTTRRATRMIGWPA